MQCIMQCLPHNWQCWLCLFAAKQLIQNQSRNRSVSKHRLLLNKYEHAEDDLSDSSTVSDEELLKMRLDILDDNSSDESIAANDLETRTTPSTSKKRVLFSDVIEVIWLGDLHPCSAFERISASKELKTLLQAPLTDERIVEIEGEWFNMGASSVPTEIFAMGADGRTYSGDELRILYTSEPAYPVVFTLRDAAEHHSTKAAWPSPPSKDVSAVSTSEALCEVEKDTRSLCSRVEPNTVWGQDDKYMLVWSDSFDAFEPEVLQDMVDSGVYNISQLCRRYERSQMEQLEILALNEAAERSRAAYRRQYEVQLLPILRCPNVDFPLLERATGL